MPIVRFEPSHLRVEGAAGESLFQIGRRHGVPIATACAGKANCGLCKVKIVAGEALLTPFCADERKHLGNVYFLTKERLSCQARLREAGEGEEIVVELPPPRIRKT